MNSQNTESEIIGGFRQFATENGIELPDNIIADGKIHRFRLADEAKGKTSGAYKLYTDGRPAGFLQNFKTGFKENWKFSSENYQAPTLSSEQREKLAEEFEIKKQQALATLQENYVKATNAARKEWNNTAPATEHIYASHKGVQLHNARLSEYKGVQQLIIPLQNIDGKLVSLQRIKAVGVKEDGSLEFQKKILADSQKSGSFSILNKSPDPKIIAIAEGFATIASVIEDTYSIENNVMGVMAVDSGNLKAVAKAMRELHPTSQILVFGDMGDKTREGEIKAKEAAEAVGGFAVFPPIEKGDWNDYLTGKGGRITSIGNENPTLDFLVKKATIQLDDYVIPVKDTTFYKDIFSDKPLKVTGIGHSGIKLEERGLFYPYSDFEKVVVEQTLISDYKAEEPRATNPKEHAIRTLASQLNTTDSITKAYLTEQANIAFGGTMSEGKYSFKDAYDLMEAAVNIHLTTIYDHQDLDDKAANAKLIAIGLNDLTEKLPTQTVRDPEMDRMQQFSTPPALSYIANWVADVNNTDTMLEPSAGTGDLAIWAKMAGAKVILNELSERRAETLRAVFPDAQIFKENAEQLNNILPDDVKPTVIVMNPPFSTSVGVQSKNSSTNGAKHIEQALLRLADNGRLVAIVGQGMAGDKPAFKQWWNEIQAKYNVRANVGIDEAFKKYGTSWGTQILVIDKNGATKQPIVTGKVDSVADLPQLLEGIKNERPVILSAAETENYVADSKFKHQPESIEEQALAVINLLRANEWETGYEDYENENVTAWSEIKKNGFTAKARFSESPSTHQIDSGYFAVVNQSSKVIKNLDIGTANTIEQIANEINSIPQKTEAQNVHPRTEPARTKPTSSSPVKTTQPDLQPEHNLSSSSIDAVGSNGRANNGNSDTGIDNGQSRVNEFSVQPEAGTSNETSDRDGHRGADVLRTGEQPNGRSDTNARGNGNESNSAIGGLEMSAIATLTPEAITDSVFSTYSPQKLEIIGAKAHPSALVQSAAMASVEPPTPTYTPKLPQAVIDDGLLSLAQLEAVVYAGQSHTETLPNGDRKGFFIGDGTGVGKGREIAGIMLDNIEHGRKKALWVSFSQGLMKDAQRDFEGVSGDSKLIFNQGKIKPSNAINVEQGILFTSYSTLAAEQKQQANDKGQEKGQSRLDQIVNWLGKDFDGVIAFDESHSMGNSLATKGKRGSSKPAKRALVGIELQKLLPNARIVYVSATGATEINNLAYANRLGLWGEGTAFANVQAFVNEVSSGGVAAMELVSRDMKSLGNYISRSLSYDGVTYQRMEHELTPLQTDIYNELATTWQVVLQNVNQAIETTDSSGDAKGAALSAFWGAHQRFFNQIITSMQTPTVIDDIQNQLDAGNTAVIQLINTNEAAQEREVAKAAADDVEMEELDFTPRQQLISYVENSFPVQQYHQVEDENGNISVVPTTDSSGNPVFNKEAIRMRDELVQTLQAIRVPDNPIDSIINHFGSDIVAEVTGRKRRFVSGKDDNGDFKIIEEKRGSGSSQADAQAFQDDKKKILIFSSAGGTGYSFHADNTALNQRKRFHYILQPGWRADMAVQGFGRTHRTNQKHPPHYVLPTTNLKAQKRFVSSVARRLDQLGALTRGQRQASSQGLFTASDNLESSYARQAVQTLFQDMYRNRVVGLDFHEVTREMGLDLIDKKTGGIKDDKIPEMPQFLNRLLSLTMDRQDAVFDAFEQRLTDAVDFAKQQGVYDEGLKTFRAKNIVKTGDTVVYTEPKTGAQTRMVELEVTHDKTYRNWKAISEISTEAAAKNENGGFFIGLNGKFKDKVFHLTDRHTSLNAEGKEVHKGTIRGIDGKHYVDNANDFLQGYKASGYGERLPISRALTEVEAKDLWGKEIAAAPQTEIGKINLLTGVILPIWDRVSSGTDYTIYRTQTDNGEQLLGRFLNEERAKETLKNLGVASSYTSMSNEDLYANAQAGNNLILANGWMITTAKVNNETRLEIRSNANPKATSFFTPANQTLLTEQGINVERIQWTDRLFIPNGANGQDVFNRIIASKPVIDIQGDKIIGKATAAQQPELNDNAVLDALRKGGRGALLPEQPPAPTTAPPDTVREFTQLHSIQLNWSEQSDVENKVFASFSELQEFMQSEFQLESNIPLGGYRKHQLSIEMSTSDNEHNITLTPRVDVSRMYAHYNPFTMNLSEFLAKHYAQEQFHRTLEGEFFTAQIPIEPDLHAKVTTAETIEPKPEQTPETIVLSGDMVNIPIAEKPTTAQSETVEVKAWMMTSAEFASVATAEPLINHGRKWEVFAGGQTFGFTDSETAAEAIKEAHESSVNNALYSRTKENDSSFYPTKEMPPTNVLAEYPEMASRFPELFPHTETLKNTAEQIRPEDVTMATEPAEKINVSTEAPLNVTKKLTNILMKELTAAGVDNSHNDITIHFKDPEYSHTSGGYHPVEISINEAGKINYITDYTYFGRDRELVKDLDFDFSQGVFQQLGIGYSNEYPIRAGAGLFRTWQSNFSHYYESGVYEVEIQTDKGVFKQGESELYADVQIETDLEQTATVQSLEAPAQAETTITNLRKYSLMPYSAVQLLPDDERRIVEDLVIKYDELPFSDIRSLSNAEYLDAYNLLEEHNHHIETHSLIAARKGNDELATEFRAIAASNKPENRNSDEKELAWSTRHKEALYNLHNLPEPEALLDPPTVDISMPGTANHFPITAETLQKMIAEGERALDLKFADYSKVDAGHEKFDDRLLGDIAERSSIRQHITDSTPDLDKQLAELDFKEMVLIENSEKYSTAYEFSQETAESSKDYAAHLNQLIYEYQESELAKETAKEESQPSDFQVNYKKNDSELTYSAYAPTLVDAVVLAEKYKSEAVNLLQEGKYEDFVSKINGLWTMPNGNVLESALTPDELTDYVGKLSSLEALNRDSGQYLPEQERAPEAAPIEQETTVREFTKVDSIILEWSEASNGDEEGKTFQSFNDLQKFMLSEYESADDIPADTNYNKHKISVSMTTENGQDNINLSIGGIGRIDVGREEDGHFNPFMMNLSEYIAQDYTEVKISNEGQQYKVIIPIEQDLPRIMFDIEFEDEQKQATNQELELNQPPAPETQQTTTAAGDIPEIETNSIENITQLDKVYPEFEVEAEAEKELKTLKLENQKKEAAVFEILTSQYDWAKTNNLSLLSKNVGGAESNIINPNGDYLVHLKNDNEKLALFGKFAKIAEINENSDIKLIAEEINNKAMEWAKQNAKDPSTLKTTAEPKTEQPKVNAPEQATLPLTAPEQTKAEPKQGTTAPEIDNRIPPEVAAKYIQVENKFYNRKNQDVVIFEDKSSKLETKLNSPALVIDLVKIASERGWKEIKITGAPEFKREVWLEAETRGLKTIGYTPTEFDKKSLELRLANAKTNTIEKYNPLEKATTPDTTTAPVKADVKQPTLSKPKKPSQTELEL